MTALAIPELSNQFLTFFPNAYFIDGDKIEDKATFLKEFAQQLKFPDYFGANWDAFSDCMTDLSWLNLENGFLIVYKNSHNFRSKKVDDWKIANEILLEAMDYWQEQGKSMITVLL